MRELYRHRWPAHVFLPVARAGQLVTEAIRAQGSIPRSDAHLIRQAMELASFAAWRVTQGIYRFDADLYSALVDTTIDGQIPSDTLHRLPEWCVYVETPNVKGGAEDRNIFGANIHGIWALLNWDDRAKEEQLIIGFDHDDDLAFVPLPLHGSLDDTINAVIARWEEGHAAGSISDAPSAGFRHTSHRVFQPMLSLLLYLCADHADVVGGRDHPHRPEPKRTKTGLRLFPTDKPTKWDVGVRIGAALRLAYQREQEADAAGAPSGRTMRPHVRRAHWHTFLAGRRDGDRERRVKWLPPIPVNVEDVSELPSVIRPVEKP